MTIAFYILTALSVAMMAFPGALKLAGVQHMREGAEHFGIPWSRYRLIGVAEIAAVVGLLLGLHWRALGVLTGACVILLLLGALGYHVRARDKATNTGGAVVCLLIAVGYVVVARMVH
jgi:DoxX-like family